MEDQATDKHQLDLHMETHMEVDQAMETHTEVDQAMETHTAVDQATQTHTAVGQATDNMDLRMPHTQDLSMDRPITETHTEVDQATNKISKDTIKGMEETKKGMEGTVSWRMKLRRVLLKTKRKLLNPPEVWRQVKRKMRLLKVPWSRY